MTEAVTFSVVCLGLLAGTAATVLAISPLRRQFFLAMKNRNAASWQNTIRKIIEEAHGKCVEVARQNPPRVGQVSLENHVGDFHVQGLTGVEEALRIFDRMLPTAHDATGEVLLSTGAVEARSAQEVARQFAFILGREGTPLGERVVEEAIASLRNCGTWQAYFDYEAMGTRWFKSVWDIELVDRARQLYRISLRQRGRTEQAEKLAGLLGRPIEWQGATVRVPYETVRGRRFVLDMDDVAMRLGMILPEGSGLTGEELTRRLFMTADNTPQIVFSLPEGFELKLQIADSLNRFNHIRGSWRRADITVDTWGRTNSCLTGMKSYRYEIRSPEEIYMRFVEPIVELDLEPSGPRSEFDPSLRRDAAALLERIKVAFAPSRTGIVQTGNPTEQILPRSRIAV